MQNKGAGAEGVWGTSKVILLPQTDAPETKYPREYWMEGRDGERSQVLMKKLMLL